MLRDAIRKKKDLIIALKSSTLKQRNRYSKIKSAQKPVVISKSVGCMHKAHLQPGIKPAQCRDRILSCLSSGFQAVNFGVLNISLGRCRLPDHQLKPMKPCVSYSSFLDSLGSIHISLGLHGLMLPENHHPRAQSSALNLFS